MTVLDALLEAFGPPPAPASTPQQTLAAAPAQIAAAKAATSAWDASKHPRAAGGKFGATGGSGKTATTTRYLKPGTTGSKVAAIQRQLGIPADGVYGPQTKAAVSAYQRSHGLKVDGVIGVQTLAALSGHPNPGAVAPGAIQSRSQVLHRIDKAAAKVQAEGRVARRYAKTHSSAEGGVLI